MYQPGQYPNYQVVLEIDRIQLHTQFSPLRSFIGFCCFWSSGKLYCFPFSVRCLLKRDLYYRMCELREVFPEALYATSIGKLDYDYFWFLATGTTTNYFGNTNFKESVLPMKKPICRVFPKKRTVKHRFERANLAPREQERADL